MPRLLYTLLLIGGLYGCTHPIEIVGQGDVISASGQRNCRLEEAPCAFLIVGAYDETYTAVAHPGHRFSHWEGCGDGASTSCSVSVSAEIVREHWGETAPAFRAVFVAGSDDAAITASDAALFLQRATFGPTMTEIERVTELGFAAWIDEQMALPVTTQTDALLDALRAAGITRETPGVIGRLRQMRTDTWWDTVINAEDQLRQRVAFALSEILVVSDQNAVLQAAPWGITHFNDTLAEHAFGNYRELLEAVTLHPAMGDYLSMRRNEKADPANNIYPDENYAREVMQLFSIGLRRLNQDGSVATDARGEAILTYTQDDILEFARIYTGWNYADAPQFRSDRRTISSHTTPMRAFEAFHDRGSKTLLNGVIVPAGLSAAEDIDAAMDNLFHHPNIAPFTSLRLIERLVTSNPSPAYVARVADVFGDNGHGVRGDMAAVVRAILLDEDALSGAQSDTGGKLKEPLLRLSQLWRAFGARGVNGYLRYTLSDQEMGQRAYGAFSVFNFFQPGYSPPGPVQDAGLTAPEFQILNESLITATTSRLQGFAHSADFGGRETAPIQQVLLDTRAEQSLADDPAALVDHLDLLLLGGTMDAAMRQRLLDYLDDVPIENEQGPLRTREAITLIVTSPQFAVQR